MNTREALISKILRVISRALISKILRVISRAILEDWSFQHIVEDIERITETYRMIKQ